MLAVGEPSMVELVEYAVVERICVHPNWVETKRFRTYIKSRNRSCLWVLFVGRFIEKKGVIQILDAAKQLPFVVFVFVGDGPLKQQIVDAAKISVNVFLYGIKSEADMPGFYRKADLAILPSQYPEGFSAVVCESLSCGTPVMAPRDGVMPSILTDEVAVFLPSMPTAEDIVAALKTYVPRDRKKCREYALEHFSERNAEVIERALNG